MTIHTFDPRNILAVILLTFGLLTMPARAQSASTTEAPVAWAAQEGASAQALTREAPPTALANIDFDALTYGQWKELGDRLTAALRWPRGDAWEEAAVQVIYLARYYGDRIDLDRASSRLLDVYLLGRHEPERILALAALHAIGNRFAMEHLLQRMWLRQEHSPRVRRLTLAALADHYGVRDDRGRAEAPVKVREAVPVVVAPR